MKRAAFAIIMLLPACTPKLDQAEVAEMLLKPERGLVGGIELGDSWDELKAHHDPRYTVAEKHVRYRDLRELRRDLSWKQDQNGFFVQFEVDSQNKIQRYEVEIDGEKRNFPAVRALRDAVIARFDAKVGAGRCADKDEERPRYVNFTETWYCNWPPVNGKPAVRLSYEVDAESAELNAWINPIPPGDQKEGCPCGCDHSEAMADDLRAKPPDEALASIARTLRIIAEREDAGFITEAMVSHRLRLLDLRSALEPHGAAGVSSLDGINLQGDRGVPLPDERQREPRGLALEDRAVRVQMELVTHGHTTEIVEEREKVLPASFRLWMEIENLTDAELALTPPTIESSVPSPISRWYVVGGDGRPWDGILRAREKTAVNAIGYLGRQVEPGTEIEATLRFHSLLGHISTRARRRWDRPE